MHFQHLLVIAAVSGLLPTLWANEVKWTATGAVTAVGGPGFTPLASNGDPVTIELRYDDGAPREALAISDIPGLLTHQEYRLDVNLDLKVTIGASTWRGTLATGLVGRPYTIEIQDFKVGPGTVDFFRARTAADDGAAFPEFPGATPGAGTKLEVEFKSAVSETADQPDYLGSIELKCVAQSISRIATAKGTVLTATDGGVEFSIDPATITTELPEVGSLEITDIQYDTEFDEVTLHFTAEPGKFYVIQYLDEFLCWREVISVFADETEESERFFPAGLGVAKTQLYRVIEEE